MPAKLFGDSNKKVVVVKRGDTVIARAIIRIMKKSDGTPVMFLENIYSSAGGIF